MSVTLSRLQVLQGVTLRYIALKTEFLNSFVSLTGQRYNRYVFMRACACLLKPCLFKRK